MHSVAAVSEFLWALQRYECSQVMYIHLLFVNRQQNKENTKIRKEVVNKIAVECENYLHGHISSRTNRTKTKSQTLNMSNAHCVQYNWSYITFISCPVEVTDTKDNIIFNWWFALLLHNRQIWFSDAAKACRNLAVRIRSCRWMERKLKLRWHSVITVDEPVGNIFRYKECHVSTSAQ